MLSISEAETLWRVSNDQSNEKTTCAGKLLESLSVFQTTCKNNEISTFWVRKRKGILTKMISSNCIYVSLISIHKRILSSIICYVVGANQCGGHKYSAYSIDHKKQNTNITTKIMDQHCHTEMTTHWESWKLLTTYLNLLWHGYDAFTTVIIFKSIIEGTDPNQWLSCNKFNYNLSQRQNTVMLYLYPIFIY